MLETYPKIQKLTMEQLKENHRQSSATWRKKHKKEIYLYSQNYYKTHKRKMLKVHKIWLGKNKEKILEYRQMYDDALFLCALDVFGEHICSRCPETDLRCLQFDHILGGGNKDRNMTHLTGTYLHMWIINHPKETKEKLQVLCANCNWRKLHENNESGKGRRRE